jgi:DNA-binding response OmpR family regulator
LQVVEHRRFDAIICDLRLPYLPGGGFYDALMQRDPAVRKFLDGTGEPYLQKPYDVNELVAAVRRVAA